MNPINERILARLVDREIGENQTYLVDGLLANSFFDHSDITSYYGCSVEFPDGTEFFISEGQRDQKIDEVEDVIASMLERRNTPGAQREYIEEQIQKYEEFLDRLNNSEITSREPMEWWICSEWMANELSKHGEMVLRNDYGTWWGRGCTGQAIVMDGVIWDIAYSIAILEGQSNDWSKFI